LEELFGLRELLECHALDGIRKRAAKSPDEVRAVVKKVEKDLLKEPDRFAVVSSFHYDLVEMSNNFRLIELYRSLSISLKRYQMIYESHEGPKGFYFEHHQDIFHALKRGDYSTAKRLLKRHIRYVRNMVERQIAIMLSTETNH
jgi:DNA-binding GntR family transcriptional regulator